MKQCPRCHLMTMADEDVFNVVSHRDNKTYICSQCGNDESLIDNGFLPAGKIERDFIAKVRR